MIEKIIQYLVRKASPPEGLQKVTSSSWYNWWGPIRESYSGAWQQNVVLDPDRTLLANSSVFHCVTGIAWDISKMRIKLTRNTNGIFEEVEGFSPYLPVLRKPNHFQNRIEFLEQWIVSKLLQGNTYILKQRDQRGLVVGLYVMSPLRVVPLVAPNGDVYYELTPDRSLPDTKVLPEKVTVPALEIIHDRYIALWHPLIGVSPLYACAMSATLTGKIQSNSINFFSNASRPSFILIAPGQISQANADLLKASFQTNFSGTNAGKVAVLGDGMKLETVQMSAEASQLAEQLALTTHDVARAFHYPHWKLTGEMPAYASNPEVLTMEYYTECLQQLIERIELLLDEGLGLDDAGYNSELDTENLWRMDTKALYESLNLAQNWMTTNEKRFHANLGPIPGGNEVMMQQQDIPLSVAAKQTIESLKPAPKPVAQLPESTSSPAQPNKAIPEDDMDLVTAYFEKETATELYA